MPLRHKVNLPYIFNLNNQEIKFKISIEDNQKIQNEIKYFEIRIETNNERFVRFIFFFKLFYFILSIIVFLKYRKKLSLQLKTTILLEQKIIYGLGNYLINRYHVDPL